MLTQRIIKAIDIFLDAINGGTLAKGTCVACAVGNLVAKSKDAKIFTIGDMLFQSTKPTTAWKYLFVTEEKRQSKRSDCPDAVEAGLECIKDVEFTEKELAKIEYTFETNTTIDFGDYFKFSKKAIRADQIKGLEAVVKVMLEFDDCKEMVQQVFTSKAELIPILQN